MNRYKDISFADLKAIFDFTREDIEEKSNLGKTSPELEKQLTELRQVNSNIYDELLTRVQKI